MLIIIQLDSTTTVLQFGFLVAADSLTQALFAPVVGTISDYFGTIRPASIICSVLFAAGNLLYSMISLVPQSIGSVQQARFVAMLIARLIVGIGSGTIVLLIYEDFINLKNTFG